MSRYQSNILDQLQSDIDSIQKNILRLKLAAYHARRGNTELARREIANIRQQNSAQYSAALYAHINFSEAICEYFERGVQGALVKFRRSKALCSGWLNKDSLPAMVSLWLASSYRVLGLWNDVRAELKCAISVQEFLTDEVLCRLSLLLGDCFQEVAEYSSAKIWYDLARRLSLKIGDDSTLGAVLYNRSALRVFNARIDELLGKSGFLHDSQVELEASSAENYSLYVEDVGMHWGFDLLFGQILMLQGESAQALEKLELKYVQNLDSSWPAVDLVRCADMVRCRAAIGVVSVDILVGMENRIRSANEAGFGFGDVAVSANSLMVALKSQQLSIPIEIREIANAALQRYQVERENQKLMLHGIRSDLKNSEKLGGIVNWAT